MLFLSLKFKGLLWKEKLFVFYKNKILTFVIFATSYAWVQKNLKDLCFALILNCYLQLSNLRILLEKQIFKVFELLLCTMLSLGGVDRLFLSKLPSNLYELKLALVTPI